ncbi:MAG: PfkB family carbohydrate kinase [Acidimicrobiales bacterium]
MSRAAPERAGSDIVVVGSVNRDYVLAVERRPEPGETIGGARLSMGPGGKGANQAVAAAASGAQVCMVARVGGDAGGAAAIEDLERRGVGIRLVEPVAGMATGAAFVLLTPDGANAIIVAPGANAALTAAEVARASGSIARAGVVVCQLEVPVEAVEAAASASSAGTLFVLNAAPAAEVPPALLERVDVLVVNEVEAAALGAAPAPGRRPREWALDAAASLCSRGPRAAIVTLGPAGAAAWISGEPLFVPAPEVQVLDTTGAGDVFVGALAASLSGRPEPVAPPGPGPGGPRGSLAPGMLAGALRLAVEAASASTTVPGAQRLQ